jgi:hypothetical protein
VRRLNVSVDKIHAILIISALFYRGLSTTFL